ncbi:MULTISPECIES: DUF397 domain-containing protein [unclassified Streptomyces]|uniref:DUF397 domain-containing protein n=1 Tax=unclassified Streptomyces TaxID=2593676 RepID=UPI000CD5A698|nr:MULTISPECIES: DUF397 domain-containing protein [unclassified Streptomyces]AWL38923.1 DUF397 domain-containing protein [Streptomyces sp. SM18]
MNHTVAMDGWMSSSFSQNNGGECVEWHPAHAAAHGIVPIRDSKAPAGPVLMVSRSAFTDFVRSTKLG